MKAGWVHTAKLWVVVGSVAKLVSFQFSQLVFNSAGVDIILPNRRASLKDGTKSEDRFRFIRKTHCPSRGPVDGSGS